MSELQHNLLAFLRGLRRLGLTVGVQEETLVFQAIEQVGFTEEVICKSAIEAIVVHRQEERAVFAVAWRQFLIWLRARHQPLLPENTLLANVARLRFRDRTKKELIWMGHEFGAKHDGKPANPSDVVPFFAGASRIEILRQQDFAKLTVAEQQEIAHLAAHIQPLLQVAHRFHVSAHGRQLDFAQTIRNWSSPSLGGHIAYQTKQRVLRPIVIVCDVSGSMDPYSRMFLRFAHVLLKRGWPIEIFVFSTRLSRVTRTFQMSDLEKAFAQIALVAPDFSGGTNLTFALEQLHQVWSKRIALRKSVVLLVTDGFETGGVANLRERIEQLVRMAYSLIWLNPFAKTPNYQPEAKGPRLLKIFADKMVPAHNWVSIEAMWHDLQKNGIRRSVRGSDGGLVESRKWGEENADDD